MPRVAETTERASTADAEDIFESNVAPDAAPVVVRATDLTGVHILKHDNLFMLSDAYGDIHVDGRGLGLYDGDTRVLSTYDLRLNGIRPVVLRAGPAANYRGTIQLTNPDFLQPPTGAQDASEIVLRRQSLGVVRERVIGGGFGERVSVQNYTTAPEKARLTLRLDADYADIFELRGFVRSRRGERLPTVGDGSEVEFGIPRCRRRSAANFRAYLATYGACRLGWTRATERSGHAGAGHRTSAWRTGDAHGGRLGGSATRLDRDRHSRHRRSGGRSGRRRRCSRRGRGG